MTTTGGSADQLLQTLADRADPEFAEGMQRYFPHQITALGVRNADVSRITADFLHGNPHVDADTKLQMADEVIRRATYHEEVLVGFALLHTAAKRDLGVELLERAGRGWRRR